MPCLWLPSGGPVLPGARTAAAHQTHAYGWDPSNDLAAPLLLFWLEWEDTLSYLMSGYLLTRVETSR